MRGIIIAPRPRLKRFFPPPARGCRKQPIPAQTRCAPSLERAFGSRAGGGIFLAFTRAISYDSGSHEETPAEQIEPKAKTDPRVPEAHGDPQRTQHPPSATTKGALAAHPGLTPPARTSDSLAPPPASLKRTEAFQAVYRRGRWSRGALVSVGALPNRLPTTRVGLRTTRGLKGAIQRNRLKRQLRAILSGLTPLSRGADVVIVIHPPRLPVFTEDLKRELISLCKRLDLLSQRPSQS